MKVKISKSNLSGVITAPPSKSISHRYLICAGLSKGKSVIKDVSLSEDISATLDCLKALGAKITVDGDSIITEGIGANDFKSGETVNLNCRESGSTLRFFIPVCAALGCNTVFSGSERLLSRPLTAYESIFKEKGILFENDGKRIKQSGKLEADNFKIKGNISSQFISGLLFALPLLKNDSTINIIPPIESRSYIDLTVNALKLFGVNIERKDERTLFIKGNQEYRPTEAFVEGDYSNAAFFECLNYLDEKNNVRIEGLNANSAQGDRAYADFFPMLKRGMPVIHLGGCPDLGPVLFALAAAKNGAVFNGTKRLKLKESDRCEAMAAELNKMGVSVKIEEDSVVIYPVNFKSPETMLCGHNDHRIVMALSILLTETGGVIDGAEAVNKSMPDFFEKLKALGVKSEFTD